MRRAVFFLPIAGLTAFVGYLGFQYGQVPSETEIINRYAAAYLQTAPTGAMPTDGDLSQYSRNFRPSPGFHFMERSGIHFPNSPETGKFQLL